MSDEPVEVVQEQRVWASPDSLKFFAAHRDRVDDLYRSERHFLPEVLARVRTVLDVGCAAGGFSQVMRALNPAVEYTGLDVVPEFVALAASRYPESRFVVGDGIQYSTPPNSYDLAHSTGILHLNSRHEEIVTALYEQARHYVLCDFRATTGPRVEGTFRLDFEGAGDRRPLLPYIVLNLDELLAALGRLRPAPRAVRLYGYHHAPSSMATITLETVIMACVLIEKGDGGSPTQFDVEIAE